MCLFACFGYGISGCIILHFPEIQHLVPLPHWATRNRRDLRISLRFSRFKKSWKISSSITLSWKRQIPNVQGVAPLVCLCNNKVSNAGEEMECWKGIGIVQMSGQQFPQ
jgi:hypothetical protein